MLRPDPPLQDRRLAQAEPGLGDVELVGIDGALHQQLAEPVARCDEDDVVEARFGVDGEGDT